MSKCRTRKAILHVVVTDGDQWEVEAEWPDGTLERINTFNDPSSATDWISTRSEAACSRAAVPTDPKRMPLRSSLYSR
jgi:hypothetical protein